MAPYLTDGNCRYPMGDKPYFFCSDPIERGAYCEAHAKLCYSGKKMKPWQDLAEMIYSVEQTVVRTS